MPVMYRDGQAKWVWPWQVERTGAEGWSADQPADVDPWALFSEAQRIAAAGANRPMSANQRALADLRARLESGGLAARDVPGGAGRAIPVYTTGDTRWVGTDMMGRPIYEVQTKPLDGAGLSWWTPYALDRRDGRAVFVEPGEMVSGDLTPLDELEMEENRIQDNLERQAADQREALMRRLDDPHINDVVRRLNEGSLDLDAAKLELTTAQRSGPQQEQVAGRPDLGLDRPTMSPQEAEALLNPKLGDPYDAAMIQKWIARYGADDEPVVEETDELQDFLNNLIQSLTSGGGGGPRYQAPDRNLVRDSVQAMMVSMVGQSDDPRIHALTELYLRDHRRQFDGASVEPAQSVKDYIRSFEDYKRIHDLRPESIDEMEWVPTQAAQLAAGGMRVGEIDQRAITQAQVGTTPANARQAAFIHELSGTGRANMPAFFQQFSQAASASFRRVS